MNAKLTALYDLGQKLILLRDPQEIAEAVLDIAVRVLDLQDSDILLVDQAHQELYVAARRGLFADVTQMRLSLDGDRGLTVAAAQSGQPVYVPDVRQDPRYVPAGFPTVSELAVPIQTKGRVLGVLNAESTEFDAFGPADRELFCILANQAALALENARLYQEERRQAEGMSILNELARRINASLDLSATLDAIVAAAAELIPCALVEVSLWDEQSQMLTLQALQCDPERAFPLGRSFPPGEGYTGWLVRHRQPLLVPDVDARDDIRPDLLPGELPFQAYAGVPLLAGETLIGTLVLVADAKGAFDEADMRLLQALAHHATTAIGNARLYGRLARRHQELSALYAVSEAINRPLSLQEIMDQALDKVIEVMAADMGVIRLLSPAGEELVIAAHQGLSADYIQRERVIRLADRDPVGQVALSGDPLVVSDLTRDPRTHSLSITTDEFQAFAIVPLRAKEAISGTLGVANRQPRDFTAEEVNLLLSIGHQVGVVVENARLYSDLAQRARELEASHAVAAAVNRPGDLDEILREGLRQVLVVTGLEMGAIALCEPETETLVLHCQAGMSPRFEEWLREQLRRKSLAAWPAGEAFQVEEIPPDGPGVPAVVREEGIRLTAEVPLFAEGGLVGVLSVATRQPRPFTAEERSLLQTIGHQLGTAIATARLRQEALQAERLAAVGRVAASVAHDLRSPLGGILRSAEFLARPELSPDMRRKLSQAVVSLARRLINTTQQLLDYVHKEKLPLRRVPCSLTGFLDEVLAVLAVDLCDQGIEVVRHCHYRGEVVMDADRMAQVVYNIAANARDAMPCGGTFTVTTRQNGEGVELRFSDTGPGVPEELRERIFEPFFTHGKREGAGLGLAIARRIVEEHGGELRLESSAGRGATFVVSLPL